MAKQLSLPACRTWWEFRPDMLIISFSKRIGPLIPGDTFQTFPPGWAAMRLRFQEGLTTAWSSFRMERLREAIHPRPTCGVLRPFPPEQDILLPFDMTAPFWTGATIARDFRGFTRSFRT